MLDYFDMIMSSLVDLCDIVIGKYELILLKMPCCVYRNESVSYNSHAGTLWDSKVYNPIPNCISDLLLFKNNVAS